MVDQYLALQGHVVASEGIFPHGSLTWVKPRVLQCLGAFGLLPQVKFEVEHYIFVLVLYHTGGKFMDPLGTWALDFDWKGKQVVIDNSAVSHLYHWFVL